MTPARCSQSSRAAGSPGSGPSLAGPQRLGPGGVLAEPAGPVIHRRGQLAEEVPQLLRAGSGHAASPAARWLRPGAAEHAAGPGVDDAGYVTGAGHGPGGDGLVQPLAAVQAGGLGFTQRPPQPGQRGVIDSLLGQVAAKRRAERLPEPRVLLAADQVVPDRAEHAEVVGAGQL